jgi:hypothetical protein
MKIPTRHPRTFVPALGRCAIALALATPLVLAHGPTAQAGLIDTIRGIFTGNTGEGASGTNRGGAIRDNFCEPGASVAPAKAWRLSALVPSTAQQTAQATPTIFVYLNLETAGASQAKQQLTPNPLKQGISDLEAAELEQFRTTERVDLLLELVLSDAENNPDTFRQYYFSLPDNDAVVELPLPLESSMEIGQTYQWTVRLLCRQITSQGTVNMAEVESSQPRINEAEQTTVFGFITRVASNPQLETAIANTDPEARYQAYIDNKLWFELVADLATTPNSPEWLSLLEEWNIPTDAAEPQTLLPLTEEISAN